MPANNDVTVASRGDEDLADRSGLLHGGNLVAGNGSLQSVDGVNFSDNDVGTHAAQGLSASLADITVSSDNGNLASNHDISGTLDTVNEGLPAAVQVVELGLGDGVVDIDGRNKKLALLKHTVELVDTGGGLLRDTVAVLQHLGVLVVDESGQVTTVVKDEVQLLAVLECMQLLLNTPLVLLLSLALPGKPGMDLSDLIASLRTDKTYTGMPAAAMAAAAWS